MNDVYRWLNWSLRLGRGWLGIPVRVHWSFFIVPLLFWSEGGLAPFFSAGAWWLLLASILCGTAALYFFVYLHELGHSLAALRSGTPVGEIVIYPLGGVAVAGSRLRSPDHEMVVTLAGPMVNLVLMGVFWWGQWLGTALLPFAAGRFGGVVFQLLGWMFMVNLGLGCFNMLPMLPMDGGRMLRSFLCFKRNPYHGTVIAVKIGRAAAVVLGLLGIYLIYHGAGTSGSILIFIAAGGFLFGRREIWMAREGLVYEGGGAYGSSYGGWVETTDLNDSPGPWRRWREARHRKQTQDLWERKRREGERKARDEREWRERVDELLAKVKREGLDSLSAEERQFLEHASERFRRKSTSFDGD